MIIYKFDGSFDGLLTCVFYSFKYKERPGLVLGPMGEISMFYDKLVNIPTEVGKSERVWAALKRKLTGGALNALPIAFMCEDETFYTKEYRFICRIFESDVSVESDFSDADLLAILNNCRKVRGEAHRVVQFMRFQKAADGTYFGMMEPRYDVMHMAISHFKDRFSDSKFIIYDRCRDYGYYYDGKNLERMRLKSDGLHMTTGELPENMADPEERLFCRLWRTYFRSIAIPERRNPRKQRQDMPVRFWKYLTEMKR